MGLAHGRLGGWVCMCESVFQNCSRWTAGVRTPCLGVVTQFAPHRLADVLFLPGCCDPAAAAAAPTALPRPLISESLNLVSPAD